MSIAHAGGKDKCRTAGMRFSGGRMQNGARPVTERLFHFCGFRRYIVLYLFYCGAPLFSQHQEWRSRKLDCPSLLFTIFILSFGKHTPFFAFTALFILTC